MNQVQKIIALVVFLAISLSVHGSQFPLHAIIQDSKYTTSEQIKMIQSLLDTKNVDINAQNRDGKTALNLAIFLKKDLPLIEFLLKNGADVNIPDLFNVTPLMNAIKLYQYKVATLLLANGANVSYKNDNGYTAFDLASTPQIQALLTLKK